MNRHERRKLSRNATTEEIFPGHTHGPVQPTIVDQLTGVMDVLKDLFKGYDITLFVAEREPPEGEDRLPRFNYISTAEREDMLSVLEAFIKKNREQAAKIDKISDVPPTQERQ